MVESCCHGNSVLQPLVVLLALSGLFLPGYKPCRPTVVLKFTLCFLLCLILVSTNIYVVVNTITSVIDFGLPNARVLISVLLGLVIYLQELYLSVLFTFSVSRHLSIFSDTLKEYDQKYQTQTRNVVAIATNISSAAVFIGLVSATFILLVPSPFCMPVEHQNGSLVVLSKYLDCYLYHLLYYAVFTRAWTPCVVYIFLWLLLNMEAKRLNHDMLTFNFETYQEHPAFQIDHFRLRHWHLCHLVEKANVVLRHFLFATYAGGIPLMLLSLSFLINTSVPSDSANFLIYMVVHTCVQMALVTLTGAVLSLEVIRFSTFSL